MRRVHFDHKLRGNARLLMQTRRGNPCSIGCASGAVRQSLATRRLRNESTLRCCRPVAQLAGRRRHLQRSERIGWRHDPDLSFGVGLDPVIGVLFAERRKLLIGHGRSSQRGGQIGLVNEKLHAHSIALVGLRRKSCLQFPLNKCLQGVVSVQFQGCSSCAWSPDGGVCCRHLATRHCLFTFSCSSGVTGCGCSPDGGCVLASFTDGSVSIPGIPA